MTRPTSHPAFTLTELIVVLTVIVIMIAVSIPAFRSTIASTEASNAETQLRLAFASGRDAALRSDDQADSAVVFLFEPGGRSSAVVCEYVGSFTDRSGAVDATRDVFVPIPAFEPIQFPRGWSVRGFVPAGFLLLGGSQRDWYDGDDRYDPDERNWVFPETGFYDALTVSDGADRQSFMVRFSGETGAVMVADPREALVLLPRPTASGRTVRPFSDYRFDRGADLAALARRALQNDIFRAQNAGGGPDALSILFGDASGDTVLSRTVEQVALYREADLAAAIQVKLDPDTGSLYKPGDEPEYINRLRPEYVAMWIEGNTNVSDDTWLGDDDLDVPVARLYTLQRYTAALQPVPVLDLQRINDDFGGAP